MLGVADEVVYDNYGRMMFNPTFHFNHGKKFTDEQLEYLCKFYEIDGMKSMAMALGKTEKVIGSKIAQLRRNGKYEYYKNLNKYY